VDEAGHGLRCKLNDKVMGGFISWMVLGSIKEEAFLIELLPAICLDLFLFLEYYITAILIHQ
jgi:hypothetical protein